MTIDPNSEILSASEITVRAASKELGRNLDYSIDSLKDLEALLQHVKSRFLKLQMEGKLTEQTVQSASISMGGYLGEVIRRQYGGAWIAKNSVMKTLVINDQEFSPILHVFQYLTKDSDLSLENYWSEIDQRLQPPEKIENEPSVLETTKKTTNRFMGNKSLILGGVIGLAVLSIVGVVAITSYSNAARIPPTSTAGPTATTIPATSTPSISMEGPIDFLPNLPDGFDIDNSLEQVDTTTDGTRSVSVAFINRQAVNHGDIVRIVYFIKFYPSEEKAISEYRNSLDNLEATGEGELDPEIGIEGADASAVYLTLQGDNLAAGQYISRIKNVIVTTVGLTFYDPQTVTESFLKDFMAKVAEFHILGIYKTQ